MNHLNSITPFLMQSAQDLPLDVLYQQMSSFENAYDQMVIKGKMVDEAIESNMGEKGTVSNVSFTTLLVCYSCLQTWTYIIRQTK